MQLEHTGMSLSKGVLGLVGISSLRPLHNWYYRMRDLCKHLI